MSTNEQPKDEVPVSIALLALITALHSARTMFINESRLAEKLGGPAMIDYWKRCEGMFFDRYAHEVDAIGLQRNQQTFEAIMRVQIPEEMNRMTDQELAKRFVFDPWLGMGYGGFRNLEVVTQA